MQALLFKKTQNGGSLYILVSGLQSMAVFIKILGAPTARIWAMVRQRKEILGAQCHTLQSGLVLVKKDDIYKLIKDSDAENTKRQRKYAVSRMYLKTYDISCIINSSAKGNSLFRIV